MKAYFLKESEFPSFLKNLLKSTKVIGPTAKKNKFVFKELESPEELRLDYDTTILPAKKFIFPPKQDLVKFAKGKMSSCIAPTPQVILGLHFYEVKAIDMLDELFKQGHADRNYLANREMTTIVATNIQRVSERAFWASVGTEMPFSGHDAFMTAIRGGYVYEPLTEKGENLLKHAKWDSATEAQVKEAQDVNQKVFKQCPEKLNHTSQEIADKVRKAFDKKEIWESLSKDCFSCGTCNTVCPTCYCFDVQDVWNLDQTSGTRSRTWDGCLLEDFSTVSLGGGHIENFREERYQRFRHRIMRKATYLNTKLGGPACVGCGRCSAGCVPDIADPVKAIEKIMEA